LAIHRHQEYQASGLPMLPVTHGLAFTRFHIVLYTCLMIAITWLPFATHLSGWPYFIGVNVANAIFLKQVIHLYRSQKDRVALKTFYYSIGYLLGLFLLLLGDHYV
jgi:protoheme IX farnesyltransferase